MYTGGVELSVLLPVRNAEATVDAAVASVLADLRGADFELVLVDDRSSDASAEKLAAWARADPRIRIVPGPGQGIVAALEAGLRACSAPLLARMDADDLWLPGRYQAQRAALLANPRLAAVGGQVEIFADFPLGAGMRHYEAWLNAHRAPHELHRERYVESPLVHPATLLRRSALEVVDGYRHGPFAEDYDLWLRLLRAGFELANVPEKVLRWRDSGQRLTRADPRYAIANHLALKAEHLAAEPWAKAGLRIAGAGPTGLKLSRALRARGIRIRGFIEVHPRKVGTVIEGVPVAGYEALGAPDGMHLVVAVGAKGAREEVRSYLAPRGWVETRDFTCAS